MNFAGGTATFTASPDCPNCSVANTANAVDGQDTTKAAMTAPLTSTGSMTLRATAPKGVAFSASNAAVVLSVDKGSGVYAGASSIDTTNHQEWQVTLHTYLGDALQDSDGGYISISDQPDQREIVGLNTTKPFDSLEVIFDRTPDAQRAMNNVSGAANTLETGSANVHEFCKLRHKRTVDALKEGRPARMGARLGETRLGSRPPLHKQKTAAPKRPYLGMEKVQEFKTPGQSVASSPGLFVNEIDQRWPT
jgi:hypothetical protein